MISFSLLAFHFSYKECFWIELFCIIGADGYDRSLLMIEYDVDGGWKFDLLFLRNTILKFKDRNDK